MYLYYSHLYYPRTSFIRGFRHQNLVRPSTADNRGLTVISPTFNFRYTEVKVYKDDIAGISDGYYLQQQLE